MNFYHKMSLACGLVPMLCGVLIFTGWLITRADWLVIAGLANISGGFLLFLCGLLFIGAFIRSEHKVGNGFPLNKSLIALGILLFNFPLAAMALYAAEYLMGTSTLSIKNDSPYAITDVFLKERDLTYRFPNIPSNEEATQTFHFKYEGSVEFGLTLNGNEKHGILFGYVTGGMGANATMIIDKKGNIEIVEQF